MKIYIAGKITGDKDYKDKFLLAEKSLRQKGHSVMNPAWLVEQQGFTYSDYMDISDCMRRKCDAVLMLFDWQSSKGARRERQRGMKEGQAIYYDLNDIPLARLMTSGGKDERH